MSHYFQLLFQFMCFRPDSVDPLGGIPDCDDLHQPPPPLVQLLRQHPHLLLQGRQVLVWMLETHQTNGKSMENITGWCLFYELHCDKSIYNQLFLYICEVTQVNV